MDRRVLFIGQPERREWAETLAQLRETTGVLIARDSAAAFATLAEHPSLHRVLVAPSYRDEFPRALHQQLLARQPLAEIVVLVGPWLEGETRSGRPWLGTRRTYAHQSIPWLTPAESELAAGAVANSSWRPATWTPDEAWLRVDSPHDCRAAGIVIVCAELSETRRTLATVCQQAGFATFCHAPQHPADCQHVTAVIYDAVLVRSRWIEQTTALQRRYRPPVLVVLVNFPRPEESQGLKNAGATAVLGKPYLVHELVASLTTVAPHGSARCPSSVGSVSATMDRTDHPASDSPGDRQP